MYKTTQSNKDFRQRVASHATKGTATKGVLPPAHRGDPMPSPQLNSLAEIRAERSRVASRKSQLEGERPSLERTRQIKQADARLAILNAEIKRLEREVHDRSFETILRDAMKEILPDHTYWQIIDRAREIEKERCST